MRAIIYLNCISAGDLYVCPVPHRKHTTFRLRAQQVNATYRFVRTSQKALGLRYKQDRLRLSVGLSVPHRKHTRSPLRAQQVNAIYRFVLTSQETH
jgi:hypothetical protein